jgi:hypothetical protein
MNFQYMYGISDEDPVRWHADVMEAVGLRQHYRSFPARRV